MTSGRSARCASGSPTPTGPGASGSPGQPAAARHRTRRLPRLLIDQCEYASDVLFTDRAALETIRGDLVTAAVTALGATDVLHFLGRRPHPAFAGEVTIDSRKRLPGALPPQAVKFYDHANVFRVDINNPREFKVLRSSEDATDRPPRWCPMGVANFWRYAEVAANGRLLNTLARVPLTGEATVELDALCRPGTATGTRVAAFNAIHPDTAELFAAVLSGDFTINGFRNRDLQGKLYPAAARDAAETKRHRTSRLIAKLRGLITRVKNTRLYRLTARGLKAMWPAVRFRRIDFPSAFREAQAA